MGPWRGFSRPFKKLDKAWDCNRPANFAQGIRLPKIGEKKRARMDVAKPQEECGEA